MTDRELLEYAAKAAGVKGPYVETENSVGSGIYYNSWSVWNPLVSSADAFSLITKLKIIIDPYAGAVAIPPLVVVAVINQGDLENATRRAITRAAAEIGKGRTHA